MTIINTRTYHCYMSRIWLQAYVRQIKISSCSQIKALLLKDLLRTDLLRDLYILTRTLLNHQVQRDVSNLTRQGTHPLTIT